MIVRDLIRELEDYLHEDTKGRYYNKLYISDGYEYEDVTIDCVYYRNGEVVLQSNETDNRNWSLIIPYIIHCLRFFNPNTEVCIQVSDEDLDWEYLDTDYTYVDDDDDFQISCSSRD